MSQKLIAGDCMSCESGYEVTYETAVTSSEFPKYCPFCGEEIEDIVEEYIEDDDGFEEEEWDD